MRQRFISWTAAIRDIRADRIQFAPGERQAALRQRTFADLAFRRAQASARLCPLLVSGAFDRRAIMRLAVAAAKARRAVTGEGWRICVSAALQGTWRAAKVARLTAGWNANRPVVNIDETSVRIGPKPTMPVVRPNAALQDADASSKQSQRVPLSSNSCPQPIPPERIPDAKLRAGPLA
jgi:hypothetical protein